MTLTETRKTDISRLIDQHLADNGGACFFCDEFIDSTVPHPAAMSLAWHHNKGVKNFEVAVLKAKGCIEGLRIELPLCAPAHKGCHDEHHRSADKSTR